jgi:hypothetical protein
MNQEEMRDLFRELREEPVPADSLARVRAAVERRSRPFASWKILTMLAAAACLVAGFLILRQGKPVQKMATVEIVQTVPAAAPKMSVLPASKVKRPRRPKRVEGVPVSIRIETPDPDVVILLVN